MAGAQPLPPPQSANEVTAAIAAAVRSGAGLPAARASKVQAGAMVICSGWGVKLISDAHRFSIGHWCGRWDSNPHDVAIEGF
jgi:hypothetical protein